MIYELVVRDYDGDIGDYTSIVEVDECDFCHALVTSKSWNAHRRWHLLQQDYKLEVLA